jgi:outer membrane receptor protein involved in Fe transport
VTKVQTLLPSSIDSLRSGKRVDPLTPGLYIEVNALGRKVWRYRRRIAKSQVTVAMQLGCFPAYPIAAARMAGSGGKGDFTDLSSIPVGSIARIEILADGASAIYGSDAVGGVINMILKKDFEGAETRARFGSATSGSLRDYQFSQLAGTRWSTGHIMASYEYSKRAALPSADRRFTRSADLRPLGGDDFRNSYSIPATVLRFDSGLGTYVPGFAVPDGQDGTGLTPGAFTPGGNFNDLRTGTDILPRQSRHIGYVYAEQEASGALTLFAEGRYAHRSFFLRSPAYFGIFPVTGANPWFVSPTGAGVDLLGYSFLRELGPIRNQGSVETWSAAAGGTLELGRGWTIDAYVSRASERTHKRAQPPCVTGGRAVQERRACPAP